MLIAAGMYVPRHLRTHADPNKAAFPPKNDAGSTQSHATAANSPAAGATSASSAPVVSLQGDQGSIQVDANGNVSIDSPKGSLHVDAANGSVSVASKPQPPANPGRAGGNPIPVRAGQVPTATTPPPPPPGPSPEEIAKAEDEADKLNVRGATVSHSVDTLRQQQQAAGYSLRADIAAAQERMQMYLSKGNAALQAQDLKSAQKYFDLADAEISKIEKFLGH